MMMITRTESQIEFGISESRTASIDIDHLTGVMLVAERAPCGRMCHALVLLLDGGRDPIRIDGNPFELTEVHQYVVESMLRDSMLTALGRPTAH